MGDLLHSWITGLTAAAILAAGAEILTPKGPVEKVTRFVCGIMLTAVLMSPLLSADMETFSWSLADYRNTVAELTADLESQQNRLVRTYIEQESAAYILDEAHVLGITDGVAEVSAKWGDESWIPYKACMRMQTTQEQRLRLSSWITAQLGIPEERQQWYES